MRGQFHDVRWVLAKNAGATEVIPFGLVEVTGAEHDRSNRMIVTVKRPASDNPDSFAINGWQPIPVGQYGLVTFEGPVYVAYDTADTPAFGEAWGPQEDSYLAAEGNAGLIAFGTTTIGEAKTQKIALMDLVKSSSMFYLGKVSGSAIDSEDTGTVTQYNQLWQVTSPAVTFTVLNPHDIQLPVDLKVRWSKYPGWTHWIVEPWHWTECPEE